LIPSGYQFPTTEKWRSSAFFAATCNLLPAT
jgi:hypothetical protein